MKNLIVKTMEEVPAEDLEHERDYNSLSLSEAQMLKIDTSKVCMTLEEFAKKYEGDSVSILYKDGVQRGFVRITSTDKHSLFPLSTDQNILFDIENPPETGLVCFELKNYRK